MTKLRRKLWRLRDSYDPILKRLEDLAEVYGVDAKSKFKDIKKGEIDGEENFGRGLEDTISGKEKRFSKTFIAQDDHFHIFLQMPTASRRAD